MEFDSIFWAAMQSSLVLGLIHGINPCGHSWLVLTPFVVGNKYPKQVASYTLFFLSGTTLACLIIGASLGGISLLIPPGLQWYVDAATGIFLVCIGAVLIINPHLLHRHDHEAHGHEDEGDHDHDDRHCHHDHHCSRNSEKTNLTGKHKATGFVLFTIGFVNMIIPCPTVAIMYGYALESGNIINAVFVFLIYAAATSITVGGVIYAIYRIAQLLKTLNQHWVENCIMRTAGFVTIIFSCITLYHL